MLPHAVKYSAVKSSGATFPLAIQRCQKFSYNVAKALKMTAKANFQAIHILYTMFAVQAFNV